MSELIHVFSNRVRSERGIVYIVEAHAAARPDGTWQAWLEFVPDPASGPRLRTGEETSQPSRAAVAYWASGLEPVFLAGALARARGRPATGLARDAIVRVVS